MNVSDRAAASPPNAEAVRIFWQVASSKVGWKSLEAILGQRVDSSIQPPSAALAETKRAATALAEGVRDGRENQSRLPLADYLEQDVELPQPGDLLIVCDGEGVPVALVRTTDVMLTEDGTVVEVFTTIYPPLKRKYREKPDGD